MPGRGQPIRRTSLVAQSHAGFAASAARSVANARGGRRSSASISPMSSPRACVNDRLSALPCPEGPKASMVSTVRVLPRRRPATAFTTLRGVKRLASHSRRSAENPHTAPSPPLPSSDCLLIEHRPSLSSSSSTLASSDCSPVVPPPAFVSSSTSAAARAAAHSLSHSREPSVEASSTAMSSRPPQCCSPACANMLATQSGNHGMALRHGINTEIAGGGVSVPLFPPGGFSLARPGDPAAATFSAGGCECLSSSPSWLGLLRLQCSDCAAESRA
mmetsp:Transcript_7597/g.18825  ORF Transcript_7597/g.18825 Transcript_7597/m.18825 type:complete len:274 (+) Transcript_7597:688-1509(+)